MYKVKFSTLSYYPDIFLKSNLAVGVAFQILGTEGEVFNVMKIIPQKTKIVSFDDEIDITFVSYFLDGLKDEFEKSYYGTLEKYMTTYVNNFTFEKIQSEEFTLLSEVEEFVEITYKYILHLGIEKTKRLNEHQKKEYIARFLEKKYLNFRRKHAIHGKYGLDTFSPDFTVENTEGEIITYKIVNKSKQAIHNTKSYMLHSLINKQKIVFILEDDMEREITTLKNMANDLDIQTEVLTEKELQKL